ncbi:MAG: homoserine kinase [Myxococcaceae bacterium]
MAVHTQLTEAEFAQVALAYGLGPVTSTRFIPQGSINTNAWLTAGKGRLFLRHTTVRGPDDLAFEAVLLDRLADSRFPAPVLVKTLEGAPFLPIAGGFVTLFHPLAGDELTRAQVTAEHSERLGAELGKLHRLTNSFGGERDNPYGPEVVRAWVRGLSGNPDAAVAGAAKELEAALESTGRREPRLLPRGVIHADLFMDNVKWIGDRVSAFFDFEMACREVYVLDLAITLNAWCFEGGYREELSRALVRGYEGERRLSDREREALYLEALFGAVRFTASRLRDFHLSPLPPERLARKDYRTYLARVRELRRLGAEGFARMLWP